MKLFWDLMNGTKRCWLLPKRCWCFAAVFFVAGAC